MLFGKVLDLSLFDEILNLSLAKIKMQVGSSGDQNSSPKGSPGFRQPASGAAYESGQR